MTAARSSDALLFTIGHLIMLTGDRPIALSMIIIDDETVLFSSKH